jgi:outer membrane lipoprotein-sorting protein
MKLKLLIALILLGAVLLTSGCTENEMSVEEITEKMQEKQDALEDYSATVQITVSYGEDTQIMEYEILQKNPDKTKKTMILPHEEAGTIIVNNSGQSWRYDPEDDVYQIYDGLGMPGEDDQIDYFGIIEYYMNEADNSFLGFEEYEGRETYVLLSKLGENKRDDWYYLAPELKVWIDNETWMPLKLEATDNDGFRGVIEYQDFKVNTGITDEEFMIPEGVEVVIAKSLPNQPELTLEEAQNTSNYNILVPSYLPEGAELVKVIVDNEAYRAAGIEGTFVGLIYSNEETTVNIVEEFNGNRNVVMVSTLASHEKTEKITINGEEGELVAFINDNRMLDWEVDGVRILISMSLEDREELIKIAESMS